METYSSTPPVSTKGFWMIRLTSLDVYKSVSEITEKNNKFKRYQSPETNLNVINLLKVMVTRHLLQRFQLKT